MMPSGGSIPGESALKARHPGIDRKSDHNEIDGGGDKKDGGKHEDRHPGEGVIEQPVAHGFRVGLPPPHPQVAQGQFPAGVRERGLANTWPEQRIILRDVGNATAAGSSRVQESPHA